MTGTYYLNFLETIEVIIVPTGFLSRINESILVRVSVLFLNTFVVFVFLKPFIILHVNGLEKIKLNCNNNNNNLETF